MRLSTKVNETRAGFYGTILGKWAIIAVYAVLHDQYVVRISPQHFTVYHPNVFDIANDQLLATQLAVAASVTPGLLLGTILYFVGRFGSRPKLAVRGILGSVGSLVIVTEVFALISLAITGITRKGFYPDFVYPSSDFDLVCTQTVQLTTYLVGVMGASLLVVVTWLKRLRQ